MLSQIQDKLVLALSVAAVMIGTYGLYLLVSKDATQIVMSIVAVVGGAFGLGFLAQRIYNQYRGIS